MTPNSENMIPKTKEIDVKLGKNIARIRREMGYTQRSMEEDCYISRAYLGKVEKGYHSLTIDKLEDIAKALQINILELFYNENGERIL